MSTTRKVVEAAYKMGIHRFAAATPHSSPLSPIHLQVLRLMIAEGHDIEVLPCIEIPIKLGGVRIDAYRRWGTYASLEGRLHSEAKIRMLNDPILNFREDWKDWLSKSRPYEKEDFQRLTIDLKVMDEDLQFFAELPVSHIEFGSEADFLAMSGRFDLLGDLVDKANGHGFQNVLFGVHHAGITIPKLEDKLEGVQGYVTPLNPLGVMMFPTKSLAEQAVRSARKSIFAIKPLAGGRVTPKKAFTYIFGFPVKDCMIGVGSIDELKETTKTAINIIENMS